MVRPSHNIVVFECSARRDPRWWLMGVLGAAFVSASLMVNPKDNCSEGGECAPWLVPVAGAVGALGLVGAAGQLVANTRRGSRLDLEAGTLEWWQGRTRQRPGNHGFIALADISRIVVRRGDGSSDLISLYDQQGERLRLFDSEVIGETPEEWARKLVLFAPRIVFDLQD